MLKLKSHFPNLSAKNLEFQNYCVLLHIFFHPFLILLTTIINLIQSRVFLEEEASFGKKNILRPGGMLV